MKISFLVLIAPLLMAASPADQFIQDIRTKYDNYKRLEPKMKVEKREQASGESAEGSKAEILRHNGETKEIREEYFGESGKVKYFFYFDSGKPFFVHIIETFYSLPLMQPVPGMPKPTKTTIESRLYFKDGKLLKWLKGKELVSPTNGEFETKAQETLKAAESAFASAAKDP